ncbi:hypothetical protein C8R46DRAFT_1070082 [Mycena filopes]|nr:hypothetical protein C8R46DRAFT_1070082 [Mycena filopes]
MHRTFSPLPSWNAMTEPDPSSDEDLVPNQQPPRKRKSRDQTASQPSKRPKILKNATAPSNRTPNAVAGPSKPPQPSRPSNGSRPSQSSSGPSRKTKPARHSLTQPVTTSKQPISSAHTKRVRRTQKEKERQRSISSDDELPDRAPPKKQLAKPVPSFSASAPVRNNKFGREDVRSRFQSSKASSSKSAPPAKVTSNADIIEIDSSDENTSDVVIVVSDSEPERNSEAEREVKKRSADRKAQKRNGVANALPLDQVVVEILDSEDEPPPALNPAAIVNKHDAESTIPMPEASSQFNHLPPLPDPDETEIDPGADDHMSTVDGSAVKEEVARDILDKRSRSPHSSSAPPAATAGSPDSKLDDVSFPELSSPHAPQILREDLSDPLETQSSEQPRLPAHDRSPSLSPSFSFAPEKSPAFTGEGTPPGLLFRPNGLLSPNADNVPEILQGDRVANGIHIHRAARTPSPPLVVKPQQPQQSATPLHRPGLPLEQRVPSPYKGIRDKALGASAAALQQSLGLPTREPVNPLPRLDLSSLPPPPLPKRRALPPRVTTPPSIPAPTVLARAETDQSSSSRGQSTSSSPKPRPPSQAKRPGVWINQRSLVDAIITTGQHNTQSSTTPHPLPGHAQRVAGNKVQTPPALTLPLPKVKSERPWSSGLGSTLIDDIIDLTLSDTEAEAAAPPAAGPIVEAPVPVQSAPRPSINALPTKPQQSAGDIRQRNANRIKKMLASAAPASTINSSSVNVKSSTLPFPPHGSRNGMDFSSSPGDSSSGHGYKPTPSENRASSPARAGDVTVEMDVDNGGKAPAASTANALNPPLVTAATEPANIVQPEVVSPSPPESREKPLPNSDRDNAREVPYDRRSYDDTEVYHLEYIGPPVSAVPPRSASTHTHAVPTTSDTPVTAESTPDFESAPSESGTTPSERDFLEASGDEQESVSVHPKPFLRRSSRRSSRSSLPDELIVNEYANSSDTPASPLSPNGRIADEDEDDWSLSHLSLRPDSLSAEATATYPVFTWETYRQENFSKCQPRVYYARDLVSKLHDYINSYDDHFRRSPQMRHVLESIIRENTADDEPDAPLIEVINEIDDEPTPPWEFYYSNNIWLGDEIDPPDRSQLVGCDCKGKCDPNSKTCSCLLRLQPFLQSNYNLSPGFAYDTDTGLLRAHRAPIFECNSLCACDDEKCRNRVVQHGRKCHVVLKKTEAKGWGVFASKKILGGTFIGVYAGEFLLDSVCNNRGLVYDQSGRTYLLDIDFWHLEKLGIESEYTVDAYHVGNFTRFLNNSCDPNCVLNPCYIEEPDMGKPLLTLFAKRDIAAGEELCFSYDGYDPDEEEDPTDKDKAEAKSTIENKCYCKAKRCRGYMFS